MTFTARIIGLAQGKQTGTVDANTIWEDTPGDALLPSDTRDFCSAPTDNPLLMALTGDGLSIDGFAFDSANNTLTPAGTTTLDDKADAISGFCLGGIPHLLAYGTETGEFQFFRIEKDLALKPIYRYSLKYGEVTTGFTTVHAYTYRDYVLVLAYNMNTGDVGIYQLQVPPHAPLTVERAWKADWAKGWHQFGFFAMGGENYFIKSNIDLHDTVYIDHLMDNPSEGSHPVGRNLGKMSPSALTTVSIDAAPYFARLSDDGPVVISAIRVDCQGWTQATQVDVGAGATRLCGFETSSSSYLLIT